MDDDAGAWALEIVTAAEMARADQAAVAAGTPIRTLMERAGAAVAEVITARFPRQPVRVLCGPGDNGGDGFVTARHLVQAGWPVEVFALRPLQAMTGAAGEAARDWRGPIKALETALPPETGLVVDALFGAGLSRALGDPARAALEAVAAARLPLVCVDLPSGVSADTGAPLGFAPQADLTVTFHRKKPAHVLEPGRSLCGEIEVADIGLAATGSTLRENGPALWLDRFPWPRTVTHKAERGRLLVVSGPAWTTGAARLSSRGGLRVGAGLVTLMSPPDALAVNAAHLEAVMLKPFASPAELGEAAANAQAVIIGPAAGVGEATRKNLLALARTRAALVIDADALTSFREDPDALFEVLDETDVLTPHPGEFDRIFPGLLKETPERVTAVRTAAARSGAVVLLKGADTVIAAPDGRAAVNTNAVPWLATAGSGDVLAGLIGGLMAQGMSAYDAACAGAWMHAQAGREVGPGLISEDLPGLIPSVLSDLHRRSKRRGRGRT